MKRLPVKRKEIELDGEYEGWHLTIRMNPPIRAFGDLAAGTFDGIVKGLCSILLDWDFVDEEGVPLPPPDSESIGQLPLDLLTLISNRFATEVTALPPRP
jgi:hypothetical protein